MVPASDSSDAELLEQTARGDARAFEQLVRRWETPLYRFLLRVTGSDGLAEDVRQSTFLRVYEKAGNFRGGSAMVWIFRIAFRGAVRARRREQVSRRLLVGPVPDAELLPSPESFGDCAEAAEERSAVRAGLAELSEADRALLWLCVVESMPLDAAARVLDTPSSTLRYRLGRALARLRACVRKHAAGGTEEYYSLESFNTQHS
ncbi:MAG: RNA polymerase sigma factor [Planctomycetes bacterium]|nr:RNA polymerase sigma factor [Planctomycetota bacterium]